MHNMQTTKKRTERMKLDWKELVEYISADTLFTRLGVFPRLMSGCVEAAAAALDSADNHTPNK